MFTYVFFPIAFYFPLLVYTYVKNQYNKMYCTYTIMHSEKRNCSVFKAYFDIDENRGNLASIMRFLHTQRLDPNTEVSFDSNFLKLVKTMSVDEDEDHHMIDRFLSRGDIVFRTIDYPAVSRPEAAATATNTREQTDDGIDFYEDDMCIHSKESEENVVIDTTTDSETENEWDDVSDRENATMPPDAKMFDSLIRGVLEKVTGNESKHDDDDCCVEQLLNEAVKMAGEKMLASLDSMDSKKEE